MLNLPMVFWCQIFIIIAMCHSPRARQPFTWPSRVKMYYFSNLETNHWLLHPACPFSITISAKSGDNPSFQLRHWPWKQPQEIVPSHILTLSTCGKHNSTSSPLTEPPRNVNILNVLALFLSHVCLGKSDAQQGAIGRKTSMLLPFSYYRNDICIDISHWISYSLARLYLGQYLPPYHSFVCRLRFLEPTSMRSLLSSIIESRGKIRAPPNIIIDKSIRLCIFHISTLQYCDSL